MKSKSISVIFAIALFLFILTASIGFPIYCRPFYYAQIDCLNLEKQSGFTRAEITQAYDEVMDYLTLPGKEFGTGLFPYSEEGAKHFADCKILFNINASVLILSSAILTILLALRLCDKINPLRLGSRTAGFWAALYAIVIPLLLGSIVLLDFDRAFHVFHMLFFPGKDNWLFDPFTDPIINVLPQKFFMNCAVAIGVALLILASIVLIADAIIVSNRKNKM